MDWKVYGIASLSIVVMIVAMQGVVVFLDWTNDKYEVGMITDRYIKGAARDMDSRTVQEFYAHTVQKRVWKETEEEISRKILRYAEASVEHMPYQREKDVSQTIVEYFRKEKL